MMVGSSAVHDNIVDETVRLVESARRQDLVLRVLGGAAVQLHVGDATRPSLARRIRDMDFVAPRDQGRQIQTLLSREGYVASKEFNRLHGARRLLFVDDARGRHIDVFRRQLQDVSRSPTIGTLGVRADHCAAGRVVDDQAANREAPDVIGGKHVAPHWTMFMPFPVTWNMRTRQLLRLLAVFQRLVYQSES